MRYRLLLILAILPMLHVDAAVARVLRRRTTSLPRAPKEDTPTKTNPLGLRRRIGANRLLAQLRLDHVAGLRVPTKEMAPEMPHSQIIRQLQAFIQTGCVN
jgi:hypothetical protein